MISTIKKSELLPSHYTEMSEPSYTGKGNHNVIQLESIIEDYKELVHQLRIREVAILNKFSISIIGDTLLDDFNEEAQYKLLL